jgi:1,4-alpha-glucan branching enzyme
MTSTTVPATQIPEYDLHLFHQGHHWHIFRYLGANRRQVGGADGVLFATWAPNAQAVSVVGDFNAWDGRSHPMTPRANGVWERFVPGVADGCRYKFELRHAASPAPFLKTDPYGKAFELRPATAAVVVPDSAHGWSDADWLQQRRSRDWLHAPLSIYEVHAGSWQRRADGGFLNYRELARALVAHVGALGYTHVELLPITEHPLDDSWGYQSTGYYAPSSRYGSPEDFRWLVDHCHQHGIGVILDWAPGHFPRDDYALAGFDGQALYEYADPRIGEHRDWGTLIFDYGRPEVRNFLLASALYWLEEFHVDGLRVDAVASMLYRDYSRPPGEWLPNFQGGRENFEAIAFLRELNTVVHDQFPGCLVIAEESTSWPQVSRPVDTGGLGFSMKWNMGWMHDTLDYFKLDPVHRRYHHDKLTFGQLYAYSENFVLPFSHDEVVHMKGSLLTRMPGDAWQRYANLRLLLVYLFTQPGKKLMFMGCEFGQESEWNFRTALPWSLLERPAHAGIRKLVADLNRLYRETPAWHRHDFEQSGFQWLDCNDALHSCLIYMRRDGSDHAIIALNGTPVPRTDYRIGVPVGGRYLEQLNSDSAIYGGSNLGNLGGMHTEDIPAMGMPCSVRLVLPPLAGVVICPEPTATDEHETPRHRAD